MNRKMAALGGLGALILIGLITIGPRMWAALSDEPERGFETTQATQARRDAKREYDRVRSLEPAPVEQPPKTEPQD